MSAGLLVTFDLVVSPYRFCLFCEYVELTLRIHFECLDTVFNSNLQNSNTESELRASNQ